MSLPHPPGAPDAPPVPRTVPMPATPGSPLEPLRTGRRLDRRHWLLAGLLGIVGGAIVFQQLLGGGLMVLLRAPEVNGWDVVSFQLAIVAFGLLAVVIAFLMAPGGLGRRLVGVAVVVVAVVSGFVLQLVTFYGTSVDIPVWSRYVVSGPSLVVLGGVAGWILASGARWWAWLAVLPVVGIAALPLVLARVGVGSGSAAWVVSSLAVVVALLALVLTLPRRR